MAISRKTQKNVGKYQAKLVGPLTVRQTCYIGAGIIISIIINAILNAIKISLDIRVTVIVLIIVPAAILGTASPYGLTCFEFIKQYYKYHMLYPAKRTFQTVTLDEEMENKNLNIKNANTKKHKKSRDFKEYY